MKPVNEQNQHASGKCMVRVLTAEQMPEVIARVLAVWTSDSLTAVSPQLVEVDMIVDIKRSEMLGGCL